MINLDNEPDLWQSTHARLRGDANPATQAGTESQLRRNGPAHRRLRGRRQGRGSGRQIFGPVNYGWQGYCGCRTRPITAIAISWISIWRRWRQAGTNGGRRLVDALDVHWYPEARGSCAANPMDGCRITEENTEAGVVAARKQAPRSLWDPAYSENSWIGTTACTSGHPPAAAPQGQDRG